MRPPEVRNTPDHFAGTAPIHMRPFEVTTFVSPGLSQRIRASRLASRISPEHQHGSRVELLPQTVQTCYQVAHTSLPFNSGQSSLS